jgi:hypothetical protein
MSGQRLPILPKRLVDFATLAVGSQESVILADRVDLLYWRELTVLLRVHSHSLASGAGTIALVMRPQSWTPEDPGQPFLAAASTLLTISSGTASPALLTCSVSTLLVPAMVQIAVVGTRSNAGLLNANLSVEFSSKDVWQGLRHIHVYCGATFQDKGDRNMAGTVLQVVPKRTLDFTSVSSGSGQAQEVVLAQGIDVSAWREVSLMVRAHSTTFGGNVGQIDIYAYMEGRTPEDPGILFTNTTSLGTVTINSSTVAPLYSVTSLGSNVGSMIKIAAKGTRTTSLGSNALKADVSIDLSFKSA